MVGSVVGDVVYGEYVRTDKEVATIMGASSAISRRTPLATTLRRCAENCDFADFGDLYLSACGGDRSGPSSFLLPGTHPGSWPVARHGVGAATKTLPR